jgi:hypothetical protein
VKLVVAELGIHGFQVVEARCTEEFLIRNASIYLLILPWVFNTIRVVFVRVELDVLLQKVDETAFAHQLVIAVFCIAL